MAERAKEGEEVKEGKSGFYGANIGKGEGD